MPHALKPMRFASIPLMLLGICISCTNNNNEQAAKAPTQVRPLESPVGNNGSLPYLISDNDKLFLSWMESDGDTAIFKYTSLNDTGWSKAEEIARGTDWFVNWADYSMIGVNNGNMIAHYLTSSGEAYFAYDVNVVRKTVSESWSSSLIPHNDGTSTEHGFVTMLPISNNSFQIAWLDGRNTSSEGHEHKGAMTLRTAVLNMDSSLREEHELDDRVCDCCQTGGAITDNGPVVVYRNRSKDEVRDINIVRKVNGSWTEPKGIHADQWVIAGCPVNGPRADAVGNNLGIAWFAAPDNKPEVKVIFSDDGGASFGDPIIIDNEYPIGRVDLVMLDNERSIISWLCKEGGQTLIKAQVVYRSGHVEPSLVIAESDEARGSGFPQMAKYNGAVYFAWTNLVNGDRSKVKMAVIENL